MIKNDNQPPQSSKNEINLEIDRLESKIKKLRIMYEQYFLELLPMRPEKPHKEVKDMIRRMQRMPFQNSQTRFRLRQIVARYQTYDTYWARIIKQREEGTYSKDVFRAEMREQMAKEERSKMSKRSKTEDGMQQLYSSYEKALKKCGASGDNLNFDSFKKTLMKSARDLKANTGAKKVHYKITIKNGKPVVKAMKKS
jgi:hypothetical protein